MVTLYGVVKDRNTKRTISDAFIDLNGYTARTDVLGEFTLTVPAGSYTLRVTHRDYSPYSYPLYLLADAKVDVELIPLVPML